MAAFTKASYPVAIDSNKAKAAEQKLLNIVNVAKDQQNRVVKLISDMVITDMLVYPRNMSFSFDKTLHVALPGRETPLDVHTHALTQMAQVFEYPTRYLSKLRSGMTGIAPSLCREKLTADLNWHSSKAKLVDRRKNDAKYLMRVVEGEIRGYLTRSYKRHLASKPLMRAFLGACERSGLIPIDGHASPVRVNLQCALPYVFEPYAGEFLAVGVAWTNSDFGGGRMKVSMFMKRINGSSSIVLNDAISEVHIGPVIEEADVEMSEETNRAELDAQRKAVADAVTGQLTPAHVQGVLDVVRIAQEEEISWDKLNMELSRLMQKKEREHIRDLLTGAVNEGFEDLPPVTFDDDNDPIPTRWWASTVVGQFADKELNAERKKELQEFAGQLLGKAVNKRKKVKA